MILERWMRHDIGWGKQARHLLGLRVAAMSGYGVSHGTR